MMKMIDVILKNRYFNLLVMSMGEQSWKNSKNKIAAMLNQCDEEILFHIAEEHDCASIIYANIKEAGIKLHNECWEKRYNEVKTRIDSYFMEIEHIERQASAHNMRFILLKNSGITAMYMKDKGKCPMGDIDLVVRSDDFMAMHSIIENCGFTLEFRSPSESATIEYITEQGSAEYYKDISTGRMWLEMSVRSISGRWIRPDQEPDTDQLFQSAMHISDASDVLNPVENLLQVCLHTAKHSFNRAPGLRLHLDVDRITAHDAIDWGRLIERVEELHVRTPVYFSLVIPKMLFNSQIPDHVIKQLKPGFIRWKAVAGMIAKTGLMHPHEKKFTKFRFMIFQLMLYDSIGDIVKLFFPEPSYMREFYNVSGKAQLIKVYMRRIADIVLRRSII